MTEEEEPVIESVIVEAVGVAVGRNMPDSLHDRIEAAMREAVEKAQAEGIADQDVIRERILAARDLARGE
jgi:hypothetical protein